MAVLKRVSILFGIIVIILVAVLTGYWSILLQIFGIVGLFLGIAATIDEWLLKKHWIRNWLVKFIDRQAPVALILAAGKSERWIKSIQTGILDEINDRLSQISLLPLPYPENVGAHKSLAKLNDVPLIIISSIKYLRAGIKDISVITTSYTKSQIDIKAYIDKWPNVRHIPAKGNLENTATVYEGFQGIDSNGDIIVSYSDIVWGHDLLVRLLNEKDGDIVLLVDPFWRENNYPKRRIWHDEIYAELVFGTNDRIKMIGEVINRFEDIPDWSIDSDRYETFKTILEHDCLGEIVGLFKFSPKGRRIFCKEFKAIADSDDKNIHIATWGPPEVPAISLKAKPGLVPLNKALLGCFLEYLTHVTDLRIKPVLLENNMIWGEIDHWGDNCIIQDRINNGEPLLD